MRIHTLMQLGFKRVKSEDMVGTMEFFKNWGYKPFTTSQYDSSLDETYTAWSLSKDDFTELFVDMPGAIITTIMGIHYRGAFYANPLIMDFCRIEKKAA
jgi:hypothetical protein